MNQNFETVHYSKSLFDQRNQILYKEFPNFFNQGSQQLTYLYYYAKQLQFLKLSLNKNQSKHQYFLTVYLNAKDVPNLLIIKFLYCFYLNFVTFMTALALQIFKSQAVSKVNVFFIKYLNFTDFFSWVSALNFEICQLKRVFKYVASQAFLRARIQNY